MEATRQDGSRQPVRGKEVRVMWEYVLYGAATGFWLCLFVLSLLIGRPRDRVFNGVILTLLVAGLFLV